MGGALPSHSGLGNRKGAARGRLCSDPTITAFVGNPGTGKTNALSDSARGGVLFIDEAYSLTHIEF